jgi:glyoxylase-like metal-dependent hydrolase (beta-lactamase superfamily II)
MVMTSRRALIGSGVAAFVVPAFLGPAALAQASAPQDAYPPIPTPLALEQVPGAPVYYVVGRPGIPGTRNYGFTSNAGFVVTKDGVVVFDALGTPSLGWALLQKIREVTDKPVRYMVVSHYHADHIYGLQAFRDHTSAVIIAQEHASDYSENEETADERASQRLDQRRSALAPWVDEKTRVIPPDIRFKERVFIDLGGYNFTLLYSGPAHSSSDIMMMVEPGGILFAGDIVQNGRVPFMNSDDVDTRQWLKSLEDVQALKPKFIIPGHGRASSAATEAIAFTHDYIEFVRTSMQKAVDDWTEFDSNNRGNAYRIYLELQQAQFGKKP